MLWVSLSLILSYAVLFFPLYFSKVKQYFDRKAKTHLLRNGKGQSKGISVINKVLLLLSGSNLISNL